MICKKIILEWESHLQILLSIEVLHPDWHPPAPSFRLQLLTGCWPFWSNSWSPCSFSCLFSSAWLELSQPRSNSYLWPSRDQPRCLLPPSITPDESSKIKQDSMDSMDPAIFNFWYLSGFCLTDYIDNLCIYMTIDHTCSNIENACKTIYQLKNLLGIL